MGIVRSKFRLGRHHYHRLFIFLLQVQSFVIGNDE